ncbi:putative membrane protein [Rudaeicoccus suwonensis]|uniref:Putative membrane protein n=1 Tax=Rudaeicoccus suwonensis TaxID=657409 RepID=A0A561EBA8_9MICO|nr:putative membrane protein [Rudaeicoccus suwonensis]
MVFKVILALHVLLAVFAVGPLVHAVTTAGRGLRTADASATAASARMVRMYTAASVLVVVVGFGLMSMKSPYTHKPAGSFGQTWVWLSLVLWVVAAAAAIGLVTPGLDKATQRIGAGEPVKELTARVAASGGVIGVLFAAIVVLMVYRPGA